MAKLPRRNTKWAFQRWVQVEVKATLVEQPLLGQGQLPDWLRNKKGCVRETQLTIIYVSFAALYCTVPTGKTRLPSVKLI